MTRALTFILPVMLLSGFQGAAPAVAQAPAHPAAAWVEHRDPLGFAVKYPQGWTVVKTPDGRIAIRSADGNSIALVQPFFLHKAMSAEAWVGSAVEDLKAEFPDVAIQQSKQIHARPDEFAATLAYTARGTPFQANVLCSIYGPSGMLFGVTAPRAVFASKRPTLIAILRTFHAVPPTAPASSHETGGPPEPEVKYVSWKDPKEGAFTVQTPAGWKIDGGLTHPATIDMRPQVSMVSPDGATSLQYGDARLGTFCLPTRESQAFAEQGNAAFREGQAVHLANGFTNIRYHYVTGAEFSQRLVQEAIGKTRPDLKVLGTKDLGSREVSQSPQVSTSSGVTDFAYTDNGKPMVGFAVVTTKLTANAGTGVWSCSEVLLGTGPDRPGQRTRMLSILEHVAASFQYDRDWYSVNWRKGYQETTAYAQLGQQVIDQMNRAAQAQMDASREAYRQLQDQRRQSIRAQFEAHEAAKADNVRHVVNDVLGQTDVRDPKTGVTYKVAAGHNYYWADPLDHNNASNVVGRDVYQRPDINYDPLEQW